VEIRLLGPVQLRVAGATVDCGPARQRCVIAALAADAGRPVQVDTLVDRVWGERPPSRVRDSLYVYIGRIRRLFEAADPMQSEPVQVLRRSGGYQLRIDPDQIDLHRFRHLVAQAGDPSYPDERRMVLLGDALDLWPAVVPLADLTGQWPARARQAWSREHLQAVLDWAATMLTASRPAATVGRLEALTDQYPLNEALIGVLMRALHGAGRHAEALDRFARTRALLAEELGADPGTDLTALHTAILLDNRQPSPPPGLRQATVPTPAQLPSGTATFVGRHAAIATLDTLLVSRDAAAGDITPPLPVVCAVTGPAGVGKTALALHWAHSVAGRFPDGHLYANLRGFDPDGRPAPPAEVARTFLETLGTPSEQIPHGLDGRNALYRSLLAGRRMLVVLDNARDAEQVRPLLPGAAGCLTLVTSRHQLTGLVAVENARTIRLDVLSPAEAGDLLTARLGDDRVAAEPEAATRLINACARLPLALSIAAARARQTGFALAALASELDTGSARLDVLDVGDAAGHVRAVFSWSYTALTPPAQHLFRLLGLHPGPDVSTAAAASLAGAPRERSRRTLAELSLANLLTELSPGRYAFHDLLRIYAVDLAHRHDSDDDRAAALTRVLDHYTHTARAADRLLHPLREPIDLPLHPPGPGTEPETLADHVDANVWFADERPVLSAVLRSAAEAGLDNHVWHLARALDTYLRSRGHWPDLAAAWQTALGAAGRLGHIEAQAYAHRLLAYAQARIDRHSDALVHLGHALDLYSQAGNRIGQAKTHHSLSYLYERRGDSSRTLHHARQALDLFRTAHHRRGQALTLTNLGWYLSRLGHHDEALAHCEQALTLFQDLEDRYGQAKTYETLGYVHHRLGQHIEAVDRYERALGLFRALGDRWCEATTLVRLGDTHRAAGNAPAASTHWRGALAILTELGHADAIGVRGKIADLGSAP
jgi:DNA-binding SARP family transcriptional activator/tetratricopeptide (TPR) repeat protein